MYVLDTTGTDNNTFLGSQIVEAVFPNSNAQSNWSPSTGTNNAACVDENPSNDDTDYVYSTTVGNKDLYGVTSCTRINANIKGVQLNADARVTDTTPQGLRPFGGQVITSRSLALYDLSGGRCSVYSNEIRVSVLSVFGPVVTPNGTTAAPGGVAHAFAGETVTFVFTLRNAGNADDAFSLYLMYPAPSDFVPARSAIYLDVDMDSLVDMGELTVSDVGPLAPGEEVLLAIQAQLPSGLAGGETANVNLVARSQADTSSWDRDNVVRIVAREEAAIALSLAADRTEAQPGDTIGFSLHFANGGERAAGDVALSAPVDLNGAAAGADFVPGSASSTAAGSFEYYDAGVSSWVAIVPPVDRIKGVRLLAGDLAPGAEGDLSFRVRVRDGRTAGDLRETAAVDYEGDAWNRSSGNCRTGMSRAERQNSQVNGHPRDAST